MACRLWNAQSAKSIKRAVHLVIVFVIENVIDFVIDCLIEFVIDFLAAMCTLTPEWERLVECFSDFAERILTRFLGE